MATKIKDVIKNISFKKAPIGSSPYLEIGDVNIYTKKYELKSKSSVAGAVFCPKNVVIVSKVRPSRGAVSLTSEEIVTSSAFVFLDTDSKKCLPKYLFYSLAWNDVFFSYLSSKATGATYPTVKEAEVLNYSLGNLPSIAEQEKLVGIFEEAESLKWKRVEANNRTKELVPALFNEMFGDIIANDKKWPIVRFSNIGKSRLGKMLDAKQQTGKNKRLYLRNANVQWDKIELHDLLEMDFSDKEQKELRLHYGDLLICEGGEIGRAAIWRDEIPECYFQKALHRVQLDPLLATPEFILYVLKALAVDGFRAYTSGTATISHLTGVQLASIRVPLPPITLQNQFTKKIKEIEKQIDIQKVSTQKVDELFNAVMAKSFA